MIQTVIKNILRKVGNYPTYGILSISREVGNIKNIKLENQPNGYLYGIHQYVKGGRKST